MSPVKESYVTKAATIWHSLDENEKTGVRFGMFPFTVMQNAEREGYNGKDLCIALMNCAQSNGGMRA